MARLEGSVRLSCVARLEGSVRLSRVVRLEGRRSVLGSL